MLLEIYTKDGVLYQSFSKIVSKNFNFSNILGSGQGSLTLDVNYQGWDLLGKIARLYIGEKLVYSGQVFNEYADFVGTTKITMFGLFDLFNHDDTTITLDTHGSYIVYAHRIISGRFPAANLTLDIHAKIGYSKSYADTPTLHTQTIKDAVKDAKYDFFLWADGVIRFKENISEKVHFFSIGKDAEILSGGVGRSLKGYVSEAQGIESGGSGNDMNVEIKLDPEVEEEFGRVSRSIRSSSGQYSANSLARATRNKLSTPPYKTAFKIKSRQWEVEVGDYITLENTIPKVENVKIVKIDHSLHSATIYLDDFSNIYKNLS